MKKIFTAMLFALMTTGFAYAQSTTPAASATDTTNGPKIRFVSLVHDYGTIEKGGDGNCEFTFTNAGNEPLILSSVRASCGCTTPSWTQKPVMPGNNGTIKVHYNTNNVGSFTKSITVTSNAVNDARVVLKIKGTVLKPEQK